MEKKELTEKAKKYVEETYKRTWEDHKTSHQRFDYLIVTVDGAGIYLSLELMKFLYENCMQITMTLKLSGIFLAFSIIFNFLSQFCTFNVFNNILKIEQAVALDKPDDINPSTKKGNRYHKLASLFMWLSICLMVAGFIGLIKFLWITF